MIGSAGDFEVGVTCSRMGCVSSTQAGSQNAFASKLAPTGSASDSRFGVDGGIVGVTGVAFHLAHEGVSPAYASLAAGSQHSRASSLPRDSGSTRDSGPSRGLVGVTGVAFHLAHEWGGSAALRLADRLPSRASSLLQDQRLTLVRGGWRTCGNEPAHESTYVLSRTTSSNPRSTCAS